MEKQIFIINGSGGSGKDSFVELVEDMLENINKDYWLENYSSVTRVKEIAEDCGWNGEKTEKDRKFLSDLKLLLTEYNDSPFKDIEYVVEGFLNNFEYDKMLFLHIREVEEIERAAKQFNAKTILVKRDSVKQIISNMADANVYNYDYDIIIENNGTLNELEDKAKQFVDDYIKNDFKERY